MADKPNCMFTQL